MPPRQLAALRGALQHRGLLGEDVDQPDPVLREALPNVLKDVRVPEPRTSPNSFFKNSR